MALVVELAQLRGWLVYHTHDSRRSAPGFPDLVLSLARPPRLIFAELKTDHGRLTPDQVEWMSRLGAVGVETYLWRPQDFDAITEVLARPASSGGGHR